MIPPRVARFVRWSGMCLAVGAGASCARFPDGPGEQDSTRVVFRMTVKGTINPRYLYIVALNVSNESAPEDIGPQPVLRYPSANGLVAGGATHFVLWNPAQARGYVLNRFEDPSRGLNGDGLTRYTPSGNVISPVEVRIDPRTQQSEDRTIGFELLTGQLADTALSAGEPQSIKVNFLTMNVAAQEGASGRVFDALGETGSVSGINETIRIVLNTSNLYSNSRSTEVLEPTDDVRDPDLDISDWSIEVRRQ